VDAPPLARLTILAAALVAMTQIAGTADAQSSCGPVEHGTVKNSTVVAHQTGGTTYGNRSGLIVIPRMIDIGYRKGLCIGKAKNWTADIAIGTEGRCAGDRSDSTNLVSFHIDEDRLYDTGTPIARACTYWNGNEYAHHNTGIFIVRIYGKICDTSGNNCTDFKPGRPRNFDCGRANRSGYTTTFAPGPNCGPKKWPSSELRDAAARGQLSGGEFGDDATLGYSEWCEFTVDASKR